MISLSVVIITFNEEKNIKRCLESVNEIADEIVVVDSFSTDATEEICSNYNVRFFKHKFLGYSLQKNYANSLASCQYILSLDADEALSKRLIDSIKEEKKDFKSDAYWFNRKTNYCGKWINYCGWYPDAKIRLWNKEKGKWNGVIHEEIKLETNKVGKLKGDILHYSYYTISQHVDQIQKFTDITARMKFEKGKNIPVILIVVRLFHSFFKKYLFQLGVLDGYFGFVISVLAVYNTFLKDIKLRELNKTKLYGKQNT